MSLEVTNTDDSALGTITFTVGRGVPSGHLAVKIKNPGLSAVSGAFVTMYAEASPGSGQYVTSGHPVVDERMGRFQITDVDSSGTAGQEVVFGQTQPLGHLAVGSLPTILAGNSLIADLWLAQAGTSAGGGAVNVKLEFAGDSPARPVPQGLTLVARGIDSGINQPKSFLISGRLLTTTGTPDDQVHAAAGNWLLGGVEYTDAGTEDLTLDQNDGNAAALTTGDSYLAAISQGTSSTPTVTKGAKSASTPAAPAPPDGELVLGFVTVAYHASASVIGPSNLSRTDLTYGRLLVTVPASGLSGTVHAGEALIADYEQIHPVQESITFASGSTNRVWLEATGAITVTQTADQPSAGALLLATAVTDGTHVTSLTDERVFIGSAGALTPHAATHGTGGTDPLSPADIGAAQIDSPTFTGNPAAPTQDPGDNSTKLATTAYADAAAAGGVAPARIDHEYLYTSNGTDQPTDLSPVPLAGSLPAVYVGGLRQRRGGGLDYTLTGADNETVVFTVVPVSTSLVQITWVAAT